MKDYPMTRDDRIFLYHLALNHFKPGEMSRLLPYLARYVGVL